MARGTHLGKDTMPPKAALDAARFVLGAPIVFERAGFAPDRPVDFCEVTLCQPVILRKAGVREAGRDRQRRGGLERDREAEDHATEDVDREGHGRAADHGPVVLADETDVAGRAVDLHKLPWRRRGGMCAGQQAQGSCCDRSLSPAGQPGLIGGLDPRLYGAVGRLSQTGDATAFADFFGQTAEARAVCLGVVLLDAVRDDRLDRGIQALGAELASGGQERLDPEAGLRLPKQREDVPPLQTEFFRNLIDVDAATAWKAGETRQQIEPSGGFGPLGIGVMELVLRIPRQAERDVVGKADLCRVHRYQLTRLVAQKHSIRTERALDTPTAAGMLHRDPGNDALLHYGSLRCCPSPLYASGVPTRRTRSRVDALDGSGVATNSTDLCREAQVPGFSRSPAS